MSNARTERYVIRPFDGIAVIDEALHLVRLNAGVEEFEPGSVVLPEDLLRSSPLSLTLPSPKVIRDLVDRSVLSAIDCAIVVIASGNTHRATQVIFQEYLRHADYQVNFVLDRADAHLILGDRAGFTLTIAVVLLHDLSPEPLRPHMSGTWLARRDFHVIPERDDSSFSPDELTDDIRHTYGLPAKAPSYIRVEEADLLDADVLSDAVRVYLDKEILRRLQQKPNDFLAIQIQTELAVMTMSTVATSAVQAISKQLTRDVTAADLDGYKGIKRFFEHLANLIKVDLSKVISFASEPELLNAHLRAALDVLKITVNALKFTTTDSAHDEED